MFCGIEKVIQMSLPLQKDALMLVIESFSFSVPMNILSAIAPTGETERSRETHPQVFSFLRARTQRRESLVQKSCSKLARKRFLTLVSHLPKEFSLLL